MSNHQENDVDLESFGPIAGLIGIWEGSRGTDISPGDPDRTATDIEQNYLERWELAPVSPPVENHDQKLRQLSCHTLAWRGTPSTVGKTAGESFHAQFGYLIWDAPEKQLLMSFTVPRGIVVNAGGTVEPDATSFELVAEAGSETYGICQNPYLVENFKVVRYILNVTLNNDGTFDYSQNTQLMIKGRDELMHHTDTNRLTRLSA